MIARFLVDTSAVARWHLQVVAAVLDPLVTAGLVGTCGVVDMELSWSTRSLQEFEDLERDRRDAYTWLPTLDEDWHRAQSVQRALWSRGRLRAVGLPDLLIAAVAEREGVTVLHYDHDFDVIAAVTGQQVRWVVPRGTV